MFVTSTDCFGGIITPGSTLKTGYFWCAFKMITDRNIAHEKTLGFMIYTRRYLASTWNNHSIGWFCNAWALDDWFKRIKENKHVKGHYFLGHWKMLWFKTKPLFVSYLLLHVVSLPDHVPSALHERKGDPATRYPVSQAREAWEPYEDPHEREVMDPWIGGCRPRHDFPVRWNRFSLIKFRAKKSF